MKHKLISLIIYQCAKRIRKSRNGKILWQLHPSTEKNMNNYRLYENDLIKDYPFSYSLNGSASLLTIPCSSQSHWQHPFGLTSCSASITSQLTLLAPALRKWACLLISRVLSGIISSSPRLIQSAQLLTGIRGVLKTSLHNLCIWIRALIIKISMYSTRHYVGDWWQWWWWQIDTEGGNRKS